MNMKIYSCNRGEYLSEHTYSRCKILDHDQTQIYYTVKLGNPEYEDRLVESYNKDLPDKNQLNVDKSMLDETIICEYSCLLYHFNQFDFSREYKPIIKRIINGRIYFDIEYSHPDSEQFIRDKTYELYPTLVCNIPLEKVSWDAERWRYLVTWVFP